MRVHFKQNQQSCSVDRFHTPKDYLPVSCDDYDYLEIWSMRKTKVLLHFQIDSTTAIYLKSFISTLTTKNKVEFLKTTTNLTFRLDHLIWAEQIG